MGGAPRGAGRADLRDEGDRLRARARAAALRLPAMDTRLLDAAGHDPVVVTGAGHVRGGAATPRRTCSVRKKRKFMGVAGRPGGGRGRPRPRERGARRHVASASARASTWPCGYIPFEQDDIDLLIDRLPGAEGRASRCSASRREAFTAVNPLLTFRCLSNMPAFHVSVNFDIQGPYLVTYPGPGQFYLALEEAVAALWPRTGRPRARGGRRPPEELPRRASLRAPRSARCRAGAPGRRRRPASSSSGPRARARGAARACDGSTVRYDAP